MEKESEKKFAFCDLSHGPDKYFHYDTDEMEDDKSEDNDGMFFLDTRKPEIADFMIRGQIYGAETDLRFLTSLLECRKQEFPFDPALFFFHFWFGECNLLPDNCINIKFFGPRFNRKVLCDVYSIRSTVKWDLIGGVDSKFEPGIWQNREPITLRQGSYTMAKKMTAKSTRLFFGVHQEGDKLRLLPKENVDEMKMLSSVCSEEGVKWHDTASYGEKMEKLNELKKQLGLVKNKLIALDETRNPINFNREIYDQGFKTTKNITLDMTKPLNYKPKKPKQKKQNGKMLRRQRQAKKA